MITYKLFWDEFSGWYLEIIKPEYHKPIDRFTYDATILIFDKLVRLIHPFMPFITEEIWQLIQERKDGESIMISRFPEAKKYNKELITGFEVAKETISAIRTIRKEKEIPNKETLDLFILNDRDNVIADFLPVIGKLCNLSEIKFVSEKLEGAAIIYDWHN